jgi:predicted transcriptional regulator
MPEQRTPSPAEQDRVIDAAVLDLLMSPRNQRPWSVDEIEREIGKETPDSLNRLYGAGLIHRLDRFAWASRAAIMAEAIQM